MQVVRAMKRHVFFLLLCSSLLLPAPAGADPLAELAGAHNVHLFAATCRAAYTDHRSELLLEMLREEGWQIETYFQAGERADAKFFTAVRPGNDERPPMYLIAIAGTESKKDILVDLTFDKTPFAEQPPSGPAEHQPANAAGSDVLLVHKGFLRYVKTALTVRDPGQPDLVQDLLAHPERKVYLVGHSLGGAVATLGGAALLEMGVLPEQVEVVTFGAPPVGNKAFADAFAGRLQLTRVVTAGDPVAGFLLDLVGGYRQFGTEVKWSSPRDLHKSPHSMAVYGDLAMKRYYDQQRAAQQAGLVVPGQTKKTAEQPVVYLAPVINHLPEALQAEFPYMQAFARELYSSRLPGYVFDTEQAAPPSLAGALQRAAAVGADAVVMTEVQAEQSREAKQLYHVTVSQSVYRVKDGALVSFAALGSNTRELTPLEAFCRGVVDATMSSDAWLGQLSEL